MEYHSFFYSIAFILASSYFSVTAKAHYDLGIFQSQCRDCFNMHLDRKARDLLDKGMAYTTHEGWVVQDIDAPDSIVWDHILDFGNYKNKVPDIVDSEIYGEDKTTKESERIFVRIVTCFSIFRINIFIKAQHFPERRFLTWSLDNSKRNDVNDSVGFWHVIPHPDYPDVRTRVFYSHKLSLPLWTPTFLLKAINKSATAGGTEWVKRHSELYTRSKPFQ